MQDDEILRRAKDEMAEAMRALGHYKLTHWVEGDGESLYLIDLLTPEGDETVKRGNEEIEMLADFVLAEICEPFVRRELAAARDREGKLREALEHYAAVKTWGCADDEQCTNSRCGHRDLYIGSETELGYQVAREALAAAAEQAGGE